MKTSLIHVTALLIFSLSCSQEDLINLKSNSLNYEYLNSSFNVNSEESSAESVFIKPDGTKMYIIGQNSDAVHQYTLSTPWEISTASYDDLNFSVKIQEDVSLGIHFSPLGDKLYMVGALQENIFQYTLTTPWDISTATYNNKKFFLSAPTISPQGIFFKPDGMKVYVIGSASDKVRQFSLSIPWDISTASDDNLNIDITSEDRSATDLYFNSEGTLMFITGSETDNVYQYSLTTPWDISSANYDSISFDISQQSIGVGGIFFNTDMTLMYICNGGSPNRVFQYGVVVN